MHDLPKNSSEMEELKMKLSKILGKDIRSGDSASPAEASAPPVPLGNASPPSEHLIKGELVERLEKSGATELVKHAQELTEVLEKNNLQSTVARVVLALDISGSMTGQYENGSVREIINKTFPIAIQFSDNSKLELWYYGSSSRRMAPVGMENYRQAVPEDWQSLMNDLGGGTSAPAVMRPIIEEFSKSRIPVYIIFITDGGFDNASETKDCLSRSQSGPLFWQFVGCGGSGYGILEGIEKKSPNASFFALDDIRTVSDADLYKRLLEKFTKWLEGQREESPPGNSETPLANRLLSFLRKPKS